MLVKAFTVLGNPVSVVLVGAGDGTVDVAGVKPEPHETDHAAKGVLLVVKGLPCRPDQTGVDQKGGGRILVSVAVKLTAAGHDRKKTGGGRST